MARIDLRHRTQHYGATWTVWYEITRDDGCSVLAHVEGSGAARRSAEPARDAGAAEALEDEGYGLALRLAELAEAGRGSTLLTIFVDPERGAPAYDFEYEDPLLG